MGIQDGNILLKMRETQDDLTPVCRQLCAYILQNPAAVLSMSVNSLAQNSKTSDTAVMRFCKGLGFSGFRAFIVSLTTAVVTADTPSSNNQFTDIKSGDSLESIINNISLSNHQSINDTLTVLDKEALEKAVAKLQYAKRIIFCGLGASGLVCMDAEQKFMRIGKVCHAYTDGHSQLTAAALLRKNDVAVLVSTSGATSDILDTLQLIKTKGICTIGITKYGKNALSANADIVLHISTPEIVIRSGAMGSRIAMLNIVDILYATVVSRDYNNAKLNLAATRAALDTRRNK